MEDNLVTGAYLLEDVSSDVDHSDFFVPLLCASVAATTFLALGAIKLVVYLCLTRTSYSINVKEFHLEQGQRENTRTNKSVNKLSWYISNLVADAAIYPLLLLIGVYALHGTKLMETPLYGVEHINAYRYVNSIALANLIYRLVIALAAPGHVCRFKLSVLYIVVATIAYLSIIISKNIQILGLVGMVAQFHVIFETVRNVILHRRDIMTNSLRVSNILLVASLIICSLMLPITYFSVALSRQSLLKISYFSVAVFCFSAAFFGIAALVRTVQAMCNACSDTAFTSEVEVQLLLATPPKGHNTFLPSVIAQTGGKNKPVLAHAFTFPDFNTK